MANQQDTSVEITVEDIELGEITLKQTQSLAEFLAFTHGGVVSRKLQKNEDVKVFLEKGDYEPLEITPDFVKETLLTNIKGKVISKAPARDFYEKALSLGVVKKETRTFKRLTVAEVLFQ